MSALELHKSIITDESKQDVSRDGKLSVIVPCQQFRHAS